MSPAQSRSQAGGLKLRWIKLSATGSWWLESVVQRYLLTVRARIPAFCISLATVFRLHRRRVEKKGSGTALRRGRCVNLGVP